MSFRHWRRLAALRTVPPPEWLILAALLVLAVLVRVAGRDYVTTDLEVFRDWYDQLWAAGGISGLSEPIGNYNAPFLYLLVVAGLFPGATVLKIKLIFALFDAVVVYFMYRLVALRHPGWRIPTLAALVTAFLPTVVVNASMYGQCESVWAGFALGGVYLLLRERHWWAVAFFATSIAFKPQGVFILPVLLLLVLAGRVRWRVLLGLPAVYLLWVVPALAVGRDPVELLTIYSSQADDGGGLARSAPSVFQYLVIHEAGGILRNLGYLFTVAVVLGICYALTAAKAELDPTRVVTAAACFSVTVPFLLPSMHERYFYLADLLTLALAFYLPRLWWLPVVVQAASALSYLPFLSNGGPHGPFIDPRVLSTLMLVAVVATVYALQNGLRPMADSMPPSTWRTNCSSPGVGASVQASTACPSVVTQDRPPS